MQGAAGRGRPAGGTQCLRKGCIDRMDTRKGESTDDFESHTRYFGMSVPPSPTPSRGDQEVDREICSGMVCLVYQGIPVFRDTGIQDRS